MCEIKVTKINKMYHARLFLNGKFYDEMACKLQVDIGYICREMLRWADKSGATMDKFANSARRRQISGNKGEVRYIGCANYRKSVM